MFSEQESLLSTSLKSSLKSDRRKFLKVGSLGLVATGLILTGCGDDDNGTTTDDRVNLGSGDIGVLNYAYALEQLEAAFYAEVKKGQYFMNLAAGAEKELIGDLEEHERAHREFFKKAIPAANIIPALEVDFSSIDFNSRASVLGAAKTFEDLGVSAYNGAGRLLTDENFLVVAGKIVSVEARHAAAIRSILDTDNKSFAGDDVVDPVTGLDKARMPTEVLSMAATYITTPINADNLPK